MTKQNSRLKERIIDKVDEMVDCVEMVGKMEYFELHIKHVNGELICKTEYSDKDKVK